MMDALLISITRTHIKIKIISKNKSESNASWNPLISILEENKIHIYKSVINFMIFL